MRRRRRDRRDGSSYIEGIALLALALAGMGAALFLGRSIHTRYRCAGDVVAGGGAGGDCDRGLHADHAPTASGPTPGAMTVHNDLAATSPAGGKTEAARSSRAPAIPAGTAEHDQLIGRILQRTRSASNAQVIWTRNELRRLPVEILRELESGGIRVIVADVAISEAVPELRGLRIKNTPFTYDDAAVNGWFNPALKLIVIAARVAQLDAESNTVRHEVGHAVEMLRGNASHEDAFIAAREADAPRLTGIERSRGSLGAHETYAQSFADYVDGRYRWPHLHAYWDCELARRCRADGRPLDPPWYAGLRTRISAWTHPIRDTSAEQAAVIYAVRMWRALGGDAYPIH
jgi:hypothetical protein